MSFMHEEWFLNKFTDLEGKQATTEATLNRIDGKMGAVEEYYRSSQANIARIESQAIATRDRLDDHRNETSSRFSGLVVKHVGASILVGTTIALAAVVIVYTYIDTKYQNLEEKIQRIEKSVEEQERTASDKFEDIETILNELQIKRGN